MGSEMCIRDRFFSKHASEIRGQVSKYVVLKYSPKLLFIQDYGIERGNRTMEILDELDASSGEPDFPESQ